MDVAVLILLIFGLVLFVLAGFSVASRWNLIGFGLACWIFTAILTSPLIHA